MNLQLDFAREISRFVQMTFLFRQIFGEKLSSSMACWAHQQRCVDPSCLLLLKLSSINLWWKANIFRAEPEMLCGDKFRRLFASLIVMQNEKKFPSSLVPLQWVLFFSRGSFMRMEHFGIISFQWLAVYLTNSLVADSCSGMTSNCNDGIESVTAIKSRQFVGVLIWGIRLIGQRLNFRNIALISRVSSWGLTIKFN